jgi:hypothetical protein
VTDLEQSVSILFAIQGVLDDIRCPVLLAEAYRLMFLSRSHHHAGVKLPDKAVCRPAFREEWMPSKDRRRDVSSEAEPDWVDPPEAFDPLPSKGRSAASAKPRSPAGPPASVDSEADWVDGPEAFGTSSAKATTPHPADADAEAINDVHSDRVDGTAESRAERETDKEFEPRRPVKEISKATPTSAGTKPDSGSAPAEIRERFAKAFLAELQTDQRSRPDSASTTERIKADRPFYKSDESFEAALRRVLRDAANRG